MALLIHLDIHVAGQPGTRARIAEGQAFEVGRQGSGLPVDDTLMSRRHFVLEAAQGKLYLHDLGSVNGTFLNEEPVKGKVAVSDGDKIRAGETIFFARISEVGPSQISGTNWLIEEIPPGWVFVEHLGLQRPGDPNFLESVICRQETQLAEPLSEYVGRQITALERLVKNLQAIRIDPVSAGGEPQDSVYRLIYEYEGHSICQYQLYRERANGLGIATWTTLPTAERDDVTEFGNLLAYLSFSPGEPAALPSN